jgi:hypothetical protein
MNKRQRHIPLLLLAALLIIMMFAGCQEKSADSFKDITGTWQAGLMLPTSNDPAIADDPVAADNLCYEIQIVVSETDINTGTLKVMDVLGEGSRAFNMSASTTHDLYELPFTFDPETDILSGEISATNDDGTTETTRVSLIALPMEDTDNIALNGTIEMELFNEDGTSKWITTCTINAFKEIPE